MPGGLLIGPNGAVSIHPTRHHGIISKLTGPEGCCCEEPCVNSFCNAVGTTPRRWAASFSGVVGCSGCVGTSDLVGKRPDGVYDLLCVAGPPGSGGNVWECVETGSFGTHYADAGCTGAATPLTRFVIRLSPVNDGLGGTNHMGLDVFLGNPASAVVVRLFENANTAASRRTTCQATYTLPNRFTTCGAAHSGTCLLVPLA